MTSAVLQNHIAGPRIAVPRLADAAHVDHHLLLVQLVLIAAILGRDEAVVGREDARQVRVPLEAVFLDAAEQGVHLPLVVDVFGEDVFVRRLARRAVDEQVVALAVRAVQLAQKVPPLVLLTPACRGRARAARGSNRRPAGRSG